MMMMMMMLTTKQMVISYGIHKFMKKLSAREADIDGGDGDGDYDDDDDDDGGHYLPSLVNHKRVMIEISWKLSLT